MIASDKIEAIRREFPIVDNYIYLNNAGVSPTSLPVKKAVDQYFEEHLQHGIMLEDTWENRADEVRAQGARLLHCRSGEITFVRNTSHGLCLFAAGLDWREGDNVVVAVDEEYPSNVYPWEQLASRGVSIRPVKVEEDRTIPVDNYRRAIDEKTRAIAVSSVEYSTGFRNDLATLGQLARDHQCYLVVDGIQSMGVLEVDVKKLGIHLFSADSHKWLLGFPGIGVCYIDIDLCQKLLPCLVGWKSTTDPFNFDECKYDLAPNALRFEEGSPNYPSIFGMGAAFAILEDLGVDNIESYVMDLTDHLTDGLLSQGHHLVSSRKTGEKSAIVCFLPRRGNGEELVENLGREKISVACRKGSIRVSPHVFNTRDEIDRFLGHTSS